MRSSRKRRAFAAAVALLTALSLAEPATATAAAPLRRAATLESSLEARVSAAAVVGVVAPDSWLVLGERDFVFEIWKKADDPSEVRGAAELALSNCTSTSYVPCTVYIESGIRAAKDRDVANQVRDSAAAREARELRQRALVALAIEVTPELLLLPDRDFVFAIYRQNTGERVRAAALAAFEGTAQEQRDFITTGLLQAREQDRIAEIEADQEATEAEQRAMIERGARVQAGLLVGVVPTEVQLQVTDENFVRWVWNTAKESSEIYWAAMAALRSTDPAVWNAFIHTGIVEADRLDREAEKRARAAKSRSDVSAVEAAAEAAGRFNLARAAHAALAGSDGDVEYFLHTGQLLVSDNECANPALAADGQGWGRLSNSLTTTRQATTDHATARWELAVTGNTGVSAGIFMPEQQVIAGKPWDFGADVRTPGDPAQARIQTDWYAADGGYLGRLNGGYLPVGGTTAYTRISGRFTAPAGAVRAKVLVQATDLAVGAGFRTTMATYKMNPDPDVTATAVAGNGTGVLNWWTRRTDIIGWNVGRDGTDTRGSGPWAQETRADLRTWQFNLLTNETPYSLILIPKTAAGPLSPVIVMVRPSTNPAPTDSPGSSNGVEAAVLNGWGTPLAQYSDEFDYTGRPDTVKWGVAGECWDNPHADGGQRCASATKVEAGRLVMSGGVNGTTGWLQNNWKTRYGRWEARVRSRNTSASNGRTYHPLLIVWPDGDKWPEEGEYDFLENDEPGAACAVAFMHYPVTSGGTQQERKQESGCGSPLSEWHNVAFEWTPNYVRGLIDGKEWFRYAGNAGGNRRAMQSMASGHLTMQLDNFDGTNMTPATYEAEWVRVYPL
ncbi:glycoside hydrolase family 16 protein [Actinoplanes sp. NPDC049596]|uniref:glycoside hydrolase family 16 protein n=1 Tax=unclassified Actinoplanes TaxID=2626549 RepID=UPI00342E5508